MREQIGGSAQATGAARQRLGLRQSSAAVGRLAPSKSARGQAHSKTWRRHVRFMEKAACLSPPRAGAVNRFIRESVIFAQIFRGKC